MAKAISGTPDIVLDITPIIWGYVARKESFSMLKNYIHRTISRTLQNEGQISGPCLLKEL
jgi:hypothetical protein